MNLFEYFKLLFVSVFQSTGKGGQAILEEAGEKIASMTKVKNRTITVNFNADLNSSMMWNFKPQQPFIKVNYFFIIFYYSICIMMSLPFIIKNYKCCGVVVVLNNNLRYE